MAFQFQNQQLLQDILQEMRDRPSVALTSPQDLTNLTASKSPSPVYNYPTPPRAAIVTPPTTPETYAIHQIPTPTVEETIQAITQPAPTPQPLPETQPEVVTQNATPEPASITEANQGAVPAEKTAEPITSEPAPKPTPESTPEPTPEPTIADQIADAANPGEAQHSAVVAPVAQPNIDPVGETAWTTYGPTVELVIKQLMTGDYDPVMERLDDQFGQEMTRDYVARFMQGQRAKYGDFKAFTYHNYVTDTGLPSKYAAFDVGVETTSGKQLVFTITLDNQKRIAGLYVQ
ncbi:MAG: hypothetical protein ACYTGQ_03635 [Planctomycetota bacterium]